ncbi:MAG TPA: glycogen/starch synthase, partial [Bacteroidales bacterium]|nr:glycogen/starch synthase [Bacteroidales bacterium]
MQVYFIDNEDYFQRKHTVADASGNEYEDNDERAIFFARGVIETVKKLRWSPDIVHCHGWLTALVPLYLRKIYYDDPVFNNFKTIYSVYNNGFKNPLRTSLLEKLLADGIEKKDLKITDGKTDFLGITKLATEYSDGVIIGSENLNEDVSKYLDTLKKPVLGFQPEDKYIDAYDEFYNKFL